jgi:predicted methyltransferase
VTATRHRLAASMETLIDEVHPNRIKQRTIEQAKEWVNTEVETAKSLVFNARGDLRTVRVIVIGAAVVGGIAFVLIVRSLARRGRGG